ncbi:aspartate/glutamate racemase family protein [Uruburuella testudinis]|uniref:Aspartate/glutamate racemase family protein n=1 Tax=Uruburuella testudinis TaxID=1282863 RepID=A0ABY4DU02_9NEIS|nr:aspartate/glutamate racemase family protein [Uruburuella testudinis]UOO82184.1 aspartate/glutamate racemase family protein [Uruburuella testudinis]
MHIRLINPNTSAHMTEAMFQSVRAYAAPGTVLSAVTSAQGPVSIESHFDEAVSVIGVCDEILQGCAEQVDAYILACFGDPGIWAARELTDAPVIGIAQAAFSTAAMLAPRFAVVTSMQRTVIMAHHLLAQYGMASLCCHVGAVDLPVLDLDNGAAVEAIIRHAVQARDQHGAGAIVLGCGGMSHARAEIEAAVEVPVVDGVAAALKLAEMLVMLGLKTGKHGDLAYPLPKTFTGGMSRFSR